MIESFYISLYNKIIILYSNTTATKITLFKVSYREKINKVWLKMVLANFITESHSELEMIVKPILLAHGKRT